MNVRPTASQLDGILLPEIKVFIVEDHELGRTGLRYLLERDGLEVVGVCEPTPDACSRILESRPDVVVLNASPLNGAGIEIFRDSRSSQPNLRALMLASYPGEVAVCSAVLAGASGYVLRKFDGDHIAHAIRQAAAGADLLPTADVHRVRGLMIRGSASFAEANMTEREEEVLALILEGKDNASISAALATPEATVARTVHSLLPKLGFGQERPN